MKNRFSIVFILFLVWNSYVVFSQDKSCREMEVAEEYITASSHLCERSIVMGADLAILSSSICTTAMTGGAAFPVTGPAIAMSTMHIIHTAHGIISGIYGTWGPYQFVQNDRFVRNLLQESEHYNAKKDAGKDLSEFPRLQEFYEQHVNAKASWRKKDRCSWSCGLFGGDKRKKKDGPLLGQDLKAITLKLIALDKKSQLCNLHLQPDLYKDPKIQKPFFYYLHPDAIVQKISEELNKS